MPGSRFVSMGVLSGDFATVDFREELCYHALPEKADPRGMVNSPFRSGRTMLAHWRISKSCKRRQYSLGPCNGKSSQLKRVFRMTDLRTKNKSVYRPVLKETHRSTDSQQPQITAAMAVEEGESGARRAKRPAQAGQRDGRFRRRRLCGAW